MNKFSSGALLLLSFVQVGFSKPYLVHTEQELNSISGNLQPGNVVTIANGTYTPWAVKLTASGTEKQPITLRAETNGKVIFTGDVTQPLLQISGSYVTLSGINFTGCVLNKADGKSGLLIDLLNTRHSRITNCTFEKNSAKVQFMPIVTISGNGDGNQVDHCSFIGNIDEMDLQVKITKADFPTNTLINDNLFKDKNKVSWPVFNGGECVQIGQDPVLLGTSVAKAVVRNNRFIRCNGEGEVVSNKSSGNRYIKNTFEDCDGELVMRGGHDCVIDSNTIKGANSGIRVNGTGHTITNNTITGGKTGIRLMYGMAKGKNEIGFYIAAANCIIKNNIISNTATGILVGDNKNENWTGKFDTKRYPSHVMQDVAPVDNAFTGNKFNGVAKTIVYQ